MNSPWTFLRRLVRPKPTVQDHEYLLYSDINERKDLTEQLGMISIHLTPSDPQMGQRAFGKRPVTKAQWDHILRILEISK